MRPLPIVLVLRLSLLVAIAASAILIVEYQNAGDPAFCGVGSGCFAVRISPYSRLFGVPLPYIGLIAHSGLLAASLLARTKENHRLVALLASAGAASAVVLLLLQGFAVGAFCVWCLTVDIASIIAAAAAVLLASQAMNRPPSPSSESSSIAVGAVEPASPPEPVKQVDPFWRITTATVAESVIWGVTAAIAIGLPFLWGLYPVVPPLPPSIAALQVPGKVTLVGFTDYQCPFCRKLHPFIQELEHKHGDRIHYSRLMMPLSSHIGAMPAALAYVCAPSEKREAAADWLYTTSDESLTRTGVLAMASAISIDRAELARCIGSPEAQAEVARDKEIYEQLRARGLPLTYVGPRMIIGYDPDRIERALESEFSGERRSLKLWWLFVALGALLAFAMVYTWRVKTSSPAAAGA